MKKIMFNDKYGLTRAVLEGRKIMTRRVINEKNTTPIETSDGIKHYVNKGVGSYHEYTDKDNKVWLAWSPFKIGDELAIAQSYKVLNESGYVAPENLEQTCESSAGYINKMFVRADLMPHRIRITDIRLQRLNDITDEECIKEGVETWFYFYIVSGIMENRGRNNVCFNTPREAFAALIDRIAKKGTWQKNPLVFVYTFELIKQL